MKYCTAVKKNDLQDIWQHVYLKNMLNEKGKL